MNIGIIGIGLIGGSLGMALKRTGSYTVFAYERDVSTHQHSVSCVDHFVDSIEQLAGKSDLIVIAAPVGSMKDIFSELRPFNVPMTDVSSVKQAVIDVSKEVYGRVPTHFVPGHPIAGTEHSGAQAARADLYAGHKVVLTPLLDTDHTVLETVIALWQSIGMQVERMSVDEHDRIFALTSHMPHILAYALVNCLRGDKDYHKVRYYASSGFRDLTRIAASNPTLWRDICLSNKENIIDAIRYFDGELKQVVQALEQDDPSCLQEIFEQACQYKHQLNKLDNNQEE